MMAPVEWPIAAPAEDGGPAPARAAGAGRLPTVRLDLFLDPGARLTEQERALMTAMLTDLVVMVADEFTSMLADAGPANFDGGQLVDRLWSAGLLDIPELIALLLRRAEEERVAAFVRTGGPIADVRLLQKLASDWDSEISAAAMALILARGRRRDRFARPRVAFADISAGSALALVNAVAAVLRQGLVDRLGAAEADERLAEASRALLDRHDEASGLEARLSELLDALDRVGRLDEELIRSALGEGEVVLVCEALARRSGIGLESAWDHFVGGSGRLAQLLRMAGVSRELASAIVASMAEAAGSDAESEIQVFDELPDADVESLRNWVKLDPTYRAAVAGLGTASGKRTV